jgi:hypothetical protein
MGRPQASPRLGSGVSGSGLVVLVIALVVLFLWPAHARGYTFGPTVQQLGPEQTVFDWNTMHCNGSFAADSPARAWKDSAAKVHLTISSDNSNAMVGSSLNTVAVDCAHVLLPSDYNADPPTYDDSEWIHAPFTFDGTKVYSLIHDEYHGWEHPGMCSSQGHPPLPKVLTSPAAGFNPGCWYNAVTFATSTDGGYTFTHATPPAQRLASVPYVYGQNATAYGYFSPSNVIKKSDGYYYMVFQAEAYQLQQVGVCEARTKNPANPLSWRAWNGTAYNVQFIDPYTNPQPPDSHVCAPVQYDNIEKMVQSLTYNSFFKRYLLVGQSQWFDPNRGQWVYGFWYSTSSDLLNWTLRTLMVEIPMVWSYVCGGEEPGAYPVVLNPGSADRNFGTTSQTTYLYFTRFHHDANCNLLPQEDLLRIPIKFLSATATGP